jgi:hypothetical protein
LISLQREAYSRRKEIFMPIIEFTDAQYAYIRGFMPVAEAVMDEAVSEADAAQIIVERGFSAALADVISPAGEAINTQAMLQLAMRYPKEIGAFIAERVALGDDMNRSS